MCVCVLFTVASQNQVLVLVQVLLHELAAFSEGLTAGQRNLAVVLISELLAGHNLWNELHPVFTARLRTAVSVS